MIVKIINKSKHDLPKYETKGAAGMDLKANLDEPIFLNPLQRIVVPSGLFVEIPEGYEFQNRPKSGLASKKGIVVVLGTIDSDYRGEIGAIVFNLSSEIFVIEDGVKISQLVLVKTEQAEWQVVSELSETERGDGGFGSTGK